MSDLVYVIKTEKGAIVLLDKAAAFDMCVDLKCDGEDIHPLKRPMAEYDAFINGTKDAEPRMGPTKVDLGIHNLSDFYPPDNPPQKLEVNSMADGLDQTYAYLHDIDEESAVTPKVIVRETGQLGNEKSVYNQLKLLIYGVDGKRIYVIPGHTRKYYGIPSEKEVEGKDLVRCFAQPKNKMIQREDCEPGEYEQCVGCKSNGHL